MDIKPNGMNPPIQPQSGPNAQKISSNLIGQLDANDDNALSVNELKQSETGLHGLAQADSDQNGILSEDELLTKVRSLLENLEANKPPHTGPDGARPEPPRVSGMGNAETDGKGNISTDNLKPNRPPGPPPKGSDSAGPGKDELIQRLKDNGSDDAKQLLGILKNAGFDDYA